MIKTSPRGKISPIDTEATDEPSMSTSLPTRNGTMKAGVSFTSTYNFGEEDPTIPIMNHIPHFNSTSASMMPSYSPRRGGEDAPSFPRLERLFSNTALSGYLGPSSPTANRGFLNSAISGTGLASATNIDRIMSSSNLAQSSSHLAHHTSEIHHEHVTDQYKYQHIRDHVNMYYAIEDPELNHEYHHFQRHKKSTGFLLFLFLFLLIIRLPSCIWNLYNDCQVLEEYSMHDEYVETIRVRVIVSAATLAMTCIGLMSGNVLLNDEHDPSCAVFSTIWHKVRPVFNFIYRKTYMHIIPRGYAARIFLTQCQVFLILIFLRRSFLFSCEYADARDRLFSSELSDTIISNLGGSGRCMDEDHQSVSMILNLLIMVFFPLTLFANIPEICVKVAWANYAGAVFVYIFSAFVLESYESMLISFIVLALIGLVVMDIQKRNVVTFFTNRRLREMLIENEKIREENQASELRHMIGNVAHDLKTPLASFTTGVDFIEMMTEEFSSVMSKTPFDEAGCKEIITSIHACVTNIRNTTSFMMMTVNRCIDYTKASKGLKLIPIYDTIHLMDTLQLPLGCMQNIQNRIHVKMEAFPNHLCPHIVTDKMWFQENILCLLSNAVKHSTKGTVILNIYLEEVRTAIMRSSSDDPNDIHPPDTSIKVSGKVASEVEDLRSRSKDDNLSLRTRTSFDLMQIFNSEQFKLGKLKSKYEDLHLNLRPDGELPNNLKAPSMESFGDVVKSYLKFEVIDQSVGMSDETMATLFNPMKKIQKLAGGTGLGLYCLAKRVEALGGEYGVKRRTDGLEGHVFWFKIPYKPDAKKEASRAFSILATNPAISKDSNNNNNIQSTRSKGLVMESMKSVNSAAAGNPVVAPTTFTANNNVVVAPASAPVASVPTSFVLTVTTAPTAPITPIAPEPVTVSTSPSHGNKDQLEAINNIVAKLNSTAATTITTVGSIDHIEQVEEVLNILIVDDSPAILKMTSLMLKKLGHTFSTAEHGEAALRVIEDTFKGTRPKFDVVLMDLQMPVMDGIEATKHIRKLEFSSQDHHDIPASFHQVIIGVSANSDHDTMQESYDAGVDIFMPKPFNIQAFCEAITKLFPHRRIRGIKYE